MLTNEHRTKVINYIINKLKSFGISIHPENIDIFDDPFFINTYVINIYDDLNNLKVQISFEFDPDNIEYSLNNLEKKLNDILIDNNKGAKNDQHN